MSDAPIWSESFCLDAHARGLVLLVQGSPGPMSLDAELIAIALHGRDMGTCGVSLQVAEAPGRTGNPRDSPPDLERLADRLAQRLNDCACSAGVPSLRTLPMGLCAGRSEAAVLVALAARRPEWLQALVLMGGDLEAASPYLDRVQVPVLMIVGPGEFDMLAGNRRASERLGARSQLEVLPCPGRGFSESGLDSHRAELAADWFAQHLARPGPEGGLKSSQLTSPVGAHLAQQLAPRHSEASGWP